MERVDESKVQRGSMKFLDPEMDYAPLMIKMEKLWKEIEDKFLHRHKVEGLSQLALDYASMAQRLLYIAEGVEKEIKAEKEANARRTEELHT